MKTKYLKFLAKQKLSLPPLKIKKKVWPSFKFLKILCFDADFF